MADRNRELAHKKVVDLILSAADFLEIDGEDRFALALRKICKSFPSPTPSTTPNGLKKGTRVEYINMTATVTNCFVSGKVSITIDKGLARSIHRVVSWRSLTALPDSSG